MLPKPKTCHGCPLFGTGMGFEGARGSGANGVLIVGESAGESEAQLERLLRRAGLDRLLFRQHTVVSCKPFAYGYLPQAAIEHCAPNLDQTLRLMNPKVVIALGNTALRRLTSFDGIMRYRGRVLRGLHGGWVVATLHPSALLPSRDNEIDNPARMTGAVLHDLQKAMQVAREDFTKPPEADYLLDPQP